MRLTSAASPSRFSIYTGQERRQGKILIARRLLERGVRFVQAWTARASRGTITMICRPSSRASPTIADQAIAGC